MFCLLDELNKIVASFTDEAQALNYQMWMQATRQFDFVVCFIAKEDCYDKEQR